MTDREKYNDHDQRRLIWSKIGQLKSNCEELLKLKSDLSNRLSNLNDAVDKLIDERRSGIRNPDLKIKLHHLDGGKLFHHEHKHRSTTLPKSLSSGNIDLACGDRSSSSTVPSYPSDNFKIKLYHCLKEILPKAEEIMKLSEQIYPSE